ncbi:transporter [Planctomicrobium sp. SH661]|uniref:transporter n=1 Tax=Planctomicrobium sp. SH661 TaxID=3448124 RepID=UPI003F5B5A28
MKVAIVSALLKIVLPLVALWMASGTIAIAQTELFSSDGPEIETDRDSFTPATTLAPQDRVIFESAWSFVDNRNVPETNSLPELIARYGVNDWLELRFGWNWEAGGAPNLISGDLGGPQQPTENRVEYESQIFYGLKLAITEQRDWIPESAWIVEGGTPTLGEDTATQLFTTYVFGWTLANDWKWDTAIRYGIDRVEGDRFNLWAPSSVIKFPVGERWKGHVEYFGIVSSGAAEDAGQHYFSPGLHYLVTKDLEVGIRTGWGLTRDSANFFTNVGLGWQY